MGNKQIIESLNKHIDIVKEGISVSKWQRAAKNSLPSREFPLIKSQVYTLEPDYYPDNKREEIFGKRYNDEKRYAYAKRIADLDLHKDFDTKKIPARTMQKALRSYK